MKKLLKNLKILKSKHPRATKAVIMSVTYFLYYTACGCIAYVNEIPIEYFTMFALMNFLYPQEYIFEYYYACVKKREERQKDNERE